MPKSIKTLQNTSQRQKMKKILCCFLLSLSVAVADIVDDKVQEIIGEQSYNQNKNFINKIFQNKARFIISGAGSERVNIALLLKELKDNGLLQLKFPTPLELRARFISETSPVLLSYTLNNVLSSIGYSFFITSKSAKAKNMSMIEFSLITEHALDPMILIGELQRRGFRLNEIKRLSTNEWEYHIVATNPQLFNAKPISVGNTLSLREVSGQYWLNTISKGTLIINANGRWIPRVVCYDKNLEIINLVVAKTPQTRLNLKIDNKTAFVMITDAQNPAMIKQIDIAFSF